MASWQQSKAMADLKNSKEYELLGVKYEEILGSPVVYRRIKDGKLFDLYANGRLYEQQFEKIS